MKHDLAPWRLLFVPPSTYVAKAKKYERGGEHNAVALKIALEAAIINDAQHRDSQKNRAHRTLMQAVHFQASPLAESVLKSGIEFFGRQFRTAIRCAKRHIRVDIRSPRRLGRTNLRIRCSDYAHIAQRLLSSYCFQELRHFFKAIESFSHTSRSVMFVRFFDELSGFHENCLITFFFDREIQAITKAFESNIHGPLTFGTGPDSWPKPIRQVRLCEHDIVFVAMQISKREF
jgi:hypothetical protein